MDLKMQESLFETIPNYYKPPLPFMGNKTRILKTIKACLEKVEITKDTIFLDVFGGSGLIAHNLKMWYPNNRVIWNDFDNYQERLNKISITQEILEKINALKIQSKEKITPQESKAIKEILESYPAKDLDCITISAWLAFSGNYATTKEQLLRLNFYNKPPKALNDSKGYLQGVERVSMDFKDLLDKYKGDSILPILDPPYLQTQKGNYRMHFMVKDFLHLMDRIKDFKICLLFSSTKSENQEILEYFNIPYQAYEQNFNLRTDNKDLLLFIQQNDLLL